MQAVYCADAVLHGLALQHEPAGPEVDELEQAVLVLRQEQHVLGLQVPVDDVVGMAVCHRRQNLLEILGRQALGQALSADDAFEQLAARAQLGDDVDPLRRLVNLEHLDDVGMVLEVTTQVPAASGCPAPSAPPSGSSPFNGTNAWPPAVVLLSFALFGKRFRSSLSR